MLARISLFILFSTNIYCQHYAQSIRGVVLDISSNQPIAFANVSINSLNIRTQSDSLGNFHLKNVPIGNHSILVSSVGYESFLANEIVVISAKETFLNIQLREKRATLKEITVRPRVSKEEPLNSTASVSAKMLSVEEARRFAGGFDDPARLVSAFAGVSSNVGNNGIVVRGNSPKSLQWKFEGVEISNPNHFADDAAFGGGVLSALSSNTLANSDFFTGAFPAEYSNALSGVFDISMRKGNNLNRENTFQIGITGIDFASEGPLKKDGLSSYIVNYRYSTLALLTPILPEGGGNGVKYQDLSFKFNLPSKKAGTFSVWGLALKDYTGITAKSDTLNWESIDDRQSQDISLYMGAFGVGHKYFINDRVYLKSTLAATSNGFDFSINELQKSGNLRPESNVKTTLTNFIYTTYINSKFNAKHTNKTGIVFTNLRYDLLLNKRVGQNMESISNENGSSFLLNAYTNSSFNISDKLFINMGVSSQFFTLNNNYTIEPRLGFKYRVNPIHQLSFGYGLHSRLEKINYYFAKDQLNNSELVNKNMDFTKAHHLVLGYDFNISESLHLKVESYFQSLYNVPVIKDSSYSFLNLVNDWFFNEKLQNTGKGRNYGIDISLDKYLTKGWYYTVTSSLFNSQYTGGDNVWRNTRFNRNYVFNLLIGKEIVFGNSNQKSLGINGRVSFQGGDRYSPINVITSSRMQTVVFDETRAFENQLSASTVSHLTISYRVNKPKTTREIALKVLNVGQYHEFYDFRFNYKTQLVEEHREAIIVPNLSYRISF
ncbi:TonB-dependent receptor [Lacihabitans sp. LS3-19]|uniref:TonB-dependent receptor n=1 Tax=Lacihabitans sp. LS3-19 TaxID=2487335 RepID=UPI0020CBE81D|nr:TonB-dependent receptor [Lacihabitans sp. LS3-19]MCP9768436.1 TonB-dependent receptor [Lacihabitans sp. LS3-19]